jgi:tetratricopeptide (TPR) repeat protein
MCGGDIEVLENQTYGTCGSCGSTMTLPNIADDKRANLFNRANHFRRLNDFDKAISSYELILNEDDSDAEAHWGVLLSRYGIEYVEDPKTHLRVPTLHRMQSESIAKDPDYLLALEYAPDGHTRYLYEQEAKQISEIQKRILSISTQTEPYDVFICYKESSETGTRTKDSALAQDIYYQLTNSGIKTFYSRITLEDKLGQEYEPYIFAALNSAKVMVVVTTNPANINAVWVKNEWSRFLALMKKDPGRLLIPCYQDMDAYDLPEELSLLQSQDMSKIGFIADLIRGIKKVLNSDGTVDSYVQDNNAILTSLPKADEQLLKNAKTFIKLGERQKAFAAYKQMVEVHPDNYLGWQGLLSVITHEYSIYATNDEELTELERFASHAKRLAPATLHDELEVEFASYFRNSRDSIEKKRKDVANEINKIDLKIRECESDLSPITEEIAKSKSELHSHISIYDGLQNEYNRLAQKRNYPIVIVTMMFLSNLAFATGIGTGVIGAIIFSLVLLITPIVLICRAIYFRVKKGKLKIAFQTKYIENNALVECIIALEQSETNLSDKIKGHRSDSEAIKEQIESDFLKRSAEIRLFLQQLK